MSDPLDRIAARTLDHYEAHALDFWEGTRDHDVSQNRAALLDALTGAPPLRILDLGCGPGRDLAAFRALGHAPVGLDGCAAFVATARAHAGCEVAGAGAMPACRRPGVYVPRQTHDCDAAGLVRRHLPGLLARLDEGGHPLPEFAKQELEGFAGCGDVEHGFVQTMCRKCGDELPLPMFACTTSRTPWRAMRPVFGRQREAEQPTVAVFTEQLAGRARKLLPLAPQAPSAFA